MSEISEKFIKNLHRKSSNTKNLYKTILRRLEGHSETDIGDLTETEIEGYIKYLKDEGLKNSSINRHLSGIRMFFKYLKTELPPAVTEDELREQLEKIRQYDKIINIQSLEKEWWKQEKKAIEVPELRRILERAKKKNKNHYRTIVLLTYFGLRKTELRELKGDDVDLVNRKIHIRRSSTKTAHSVRDIPFSIDIAKYLERDGYIIPSPITGHEKQSSNAFNSMLREYEDGDMGHLYPHRFRISLNTHLVEDGVDRYVVKLILGHSTQYDMTDYYTGESKELKRKMREAMEEKHYLLPVLRGVEKK